MMQLTDLLPVLDMGFSVSNNEIVLQSFAGKQSIWVLDKRQDAPNSERFVQKRVVEEGKEKFYVLTENSVSNIVSLSQLSNLPQNNWFVRQSTDT